MPRVSILAVALAVLVAPVAVRAADLTGNWVVKGEFGPKLQHTLVCAFRIDAGKLAGPCIGAYGPVVRASGSQDSGGLTFRYLSDYQGNDFIMEYTGRFRSVGSVSGTIGAGVVSGVFGGSAIGNWPDDNLAFWLLDSRLTNGVNWSLGCAFKATGRTLNGPCAVAIGPPAHATGTADGANMSFEYDYDLQGREAHISYVGTVQPDGSVKGVVAQDGASGTFTAKHR
jgi:hypothetical protein